MPSEHLSELSLQTKVKKKKKNLFIIYIWFYKIKN
jgi:hypothetical protein